MKEKVLELQQKVEGKTPQEILQIVYEEFGDEITFATSLGEEDQVLTDMIAQTAPKIPIFTLDTGRMFQESYELLDKTQKRYPEISIEVFFPDKFAVEKMVAEQGINLFYDSIENRKMCCGVRKIEPLNRALSNKKAWIVGLRRGQSITRAQMNPIEWDEGNQLIKVAPLAFWSLTQVRDYIKENAVDISPLHAQGFVSIGCAPCTRAIKEGEDIRAGRWWWEQPEQKECGLHNNPNRPKTSYQI